MQIEKNTTGFGQRKFRPGFTRTTDQAWLVALVVGLGLSLLFTTVQIALLNTILIFLFVLFVGLALCCVVRRKLKEPKLRVLGTLWLVKLGLTLVLLYVGWMPQLDASTSASWGYDPQRYYKDAFDLIENGWSPLAGMNYQGIVYYYGAIFYMFGHNPIIPALLNAFVTLLGTLFLIRCAYEFKGARGPKDWRIAYLLLIPELLWFDVMTSRETLMAVLVLISLLTVGRYFTRSKRMSLAIALVPVGICLGSILVVRTTMAISVIGTIGIMALFLRTRKDFSWQGKLIIIGLGLAMLASGPMFQEIVGGSDVNYMETLKALKSFEKNVASSSGTTWSENSIGLLFIPSNTMQAFLFTPPRMVFYLVAPFPNVTVSIDDLLAGHWASWQYLMMAVTSVLHLMFLPYAMAGFALAWRQRHIQSAPLVLHISFWATFFAIVAGNMIIQERYRVMVTLLLFACVWLGYTSCTSKQVGRFSYPWFSFLMGSVIFYLFYKAP